MWAIGVDVVQYIPRNMHTVFALLRFVVVIHWLIFPYPSGLLHWHCGNLTIAIVPAKQPWWIWINTSCEFIMNDCITTTKQSTAKPCAQFFEYTAVSVGDSVGMTGETLSLQSNNIYDNYERKGCFWAMGVDVGVDAWPYARGHRCRRGRKNNWRQVISGK